MQNYWNTGLFWSHLHFMREKAMAPHSSTLAWKIPWMEEPGGLQSMGSLRVRHDWVTSLSLSTFMHRRRKWQPTPAFLPGESQGPGSLVGCSPWGRTESDTTAATAAFHVHGNKTVVNSSDSWILVNCGLSINFFFFNFGPGLTLPTVLMTSSLAKINLNFGLKENILGK